MSATALVQQLTTANKLKIPNLYSVDGWVCVVTGGGTGLGLVSATALAENGARVYITGRRAEPLQEAARAFNERNTSEPAGHKGEIIPIQADVASKDGIQTLVTAVGAKEKWINFLLNNHGVSQGCADINAVEQTPEALSAQMFGGENFDTWLDTYRINTASYFFTAFAFLPLLAAAKSLGGAPEPGSIVNVASMSGVTKTSQRGQFNYNASKAATISLSQMLATEFARRNLGVRVNTINPGYFPSGMTVIPVETNDGSAAASSEFRNKWGIPLARPGNATDYAQCLIMLATNQYTTGADILIDGGWMTEEQF